MEVVQSALLDTPEMRSLLAGKVLVGDAAACQNFVDESLAVYLQQNQTRYLKGDVVDQKMVAFAAAELAVKELDLLVADDEFCLPGHVAGNSNQEKKLASGGLERWNLKL